ncbi:MAG: hypothetical protein N2606_03585 [Candidatus Omnitrophica bacterium]|nr:hypothetical protein [Candidatus Omnitrophota bacterium]
MAEEAKQPAKNENLSKMMKTILMVIVGIALLVLGGYCIWRWWWCVRILIKGSIGFFFVLCGIIFLAMAKE